MMRLLLSLRDALLWVLFIALSLAAVAVVWPIYVARNFFALLAQSRYFALGVALIVADQIAKRLAVLSLKGAAPLPVIRGLLELKYAENQGAAFGILKGQTHLFIFMAFLTIVIIVVYLTLVDDEEPLVKVALVMILAGAIGNLIDRLFCEYVIDYIHVYYGLQFSFPIFNLADSVIDIGVGLILLDFILDFFREPANSDAPGPA